ncbi:pyruvate:ferredoxin (flavodoxin) oxidoreductase, partial [Enterococcus faecalis]
SSLNRINAVELARQVGLGRRINPVVFPAFFEVTDILTKKQYLPLLREEVKKTYGKKSMEIVEPHYPAIDATFESLQE